jgi:hypothetical protein
MQRSPLSHLSQHKTATNAASKPPYLPHEVNLEMIPKYELHKADSPTSRNPRRGRIVKERDDYSKNICSVIN